MHSCFIGQGLGGKSKGTLCLIWLLDLTIHFKYTSYYHGKNGNLLFPFWTRIHEAVCGRAAVCPLGTGMMLTGDRDGTFEVWVKREGFAGFPPGEQSSSELSFCSSCCLLPADLGSYVLLSTVCLSSPPIGEVLWLPLHRAWRDWEPQWVGTGPCSIFLAVLLPDGMCYSFIRILPRGPAWALPWDQLLLLDFHLSSVTALRSYWASSCKGLFVWFRWALSCL